MGRKRYFLDKERLLFRRVRLSGRQRFAKFFAFLGVSLILSAVYITFFNRVFGSPKEKRLVSEVAELKYKYQILQSDFKKADMVLQQIAAAEDNVYRPVLDMEPLSESFRQSGYGGSVKYEELEGYENSELMVNSSRTLNELLRKTYVQSKSFEEIIPEAEGWKRKLEHLPYIQPVRVNIPLGEGIKFRDEHPVLGISRWHYGQDFSAPVGTKVYATGSGTVIKAAWTPYGFGNRIEIDHGYGFTSIYGHLSRFNVEPGTEVQRGDLIGYSGSTGISTGPHLHYEIHYNGKAQNPLYFFDDDLTLEEYYEMISTLNADTIR